MKIVSLLPIIALSGCAYPPSSPIKITPIDPIPEVIIKAPQSSNYVSITTARKIILDERVTMNQTFAFMDALTLPKALNSANIVIQDAGVNTRKIISVKSQNAPLSDYIRQIEGITDYSIEIKGGATSKSPTLLVSSSITKTWDLAALSDMPIVTDKAGFSATNTNSSNSNSSDENSNASSAASGSGTEFTITREDDAWAGLILDAKEILGLNDDDNSVNDVIEPSQLGGSVGILDGFQIDTLNTESKDDSFVVEPWVVGNKRLGKITAHGKPSAIKRLDKFLSKISTESLRQVHLKASILSVSTTKGDGYGINWDGVYSNKKGNKNLTITGAATQALSLVDGGVWSVGAAIPFGDLSLSALIESLQEQGSVQLLGQPRLTVTNGYTAYLGSTQEFSFVSGIEFLPLGTTDASSTETAITTTLSRVNIGIKIAVTPRMLDNGKILLDVLPILSSVQGFTAIESGGSVFETPNIALQELATQVVTSSGKPVYLGGLIINRIIQSAKSLPIKNAALRKALGSATYEQENTELLIVITPEEVGA